MEYRLGKLLLGFIWIILITPSYAYSKHHASRIKTHKTIKSSLHVAKSQSHSKAYAQVGPASFYSDKFIGRKMADGRRYSPFAYTAAHARLPLGTKIKITDINPGREHGRTLYVEVTDRMSSHVRNIVDLTPKAARYFNNTGRGLRVRLQVVSDAEFNRHRA